jgi:hypothetical protein
MTRQPSNNFHTPTRREWLRVGGLSCLGLGGSALFNDPASAVGRVSSGAFGRAKSCIVLFLSGGPPQHETFDPKPDAPSEVRGEFASIATNVAGVRFSELLPKTARIADQLTILRSLHTGVNSHSVSGYQLFTGHTHSSKADNPASRQDWPHLGSFVSQFQPSHRSPVSAVTLPEPIVNNPGVLWPGQDGGFMGPAWDPFLCKMGAPKAAGKDGLSDTLAIPDSLSLERLASRRELIEALDHGLQSTQPGDSLEGLEENRRQAFEMLISKGARQAFDLADEPTEVRDAYGSHKFGQSVLLARRLVESGVRLVQVNFPREAGDLSSGNPLWDTHSNNAARLKNNLCPPFDQAFSALILDLKSRGLLDETLVVVVGEFGRSPKINKNGGRDHWGSCFSGVLAGAGTEGGQVIGASDRLGGYPSERPISAPELHATLLHRLGINPNGLFQDRSGRPTPITDAKPIRELV